MITLQGQHWQLNERLTPLSESFVHPIRGTGRGRSYGREGRGQYRWMGAIIQLGPVAQNNPQMALVVQKFNGRNVMLAWILFLHNNVNITKIVFVSGFYWFLLYILQIGKNKVLNIWSETWHYLLGIYQSIFCLNEKYILWFIFYASDGWYRWTLKIVSYFIWFKILNHLWHFQQFMEKNPYFF